MKILAVTLDYPPRRRIGSEVATHEVLRHLAAQGHTVVVAPTLVDARTVGPWEHDGVLVVPGITDYAALRADLVWTHAELLPRVADLHGTPVVAVTHNARSGTMLGLRAPADLIVHNAHATHEALRDLTPRTPQVVVHPIVRPATCVARGGDRDHVTIIGCIPAKGAGVFAAMARWFPRQKFLAVRGGYGRHIHVRRPNVEHLRHVDDMRTVYARTKVLLVPSVHESYGRVVVEAHLNGIPVLASDLPGLREAGGTVATYLRPTRHPDWRAALGHLLDDERAYKAASRASKRHAAAHNRPDDDLARVTDLLTGLVEAPWRAAAG